MINNNNTTQTWMEFTLKWETKFWKAISFGRMDDRIIHMYHMKRPHMFASDCILCCAENLKCGRCWVLNAFISISNWKQNFYGPTNHIASNCNKFIELLLSLSSRVHWRCSRSPYTIIAYKLKSNLYDILSNAVSNWNGRRSVAVA